MLTNSNSLLVSVIVPVYNVEPFLRQCLDSIIGQTYPNLEIILVDDGSTDNSGRICDEYAEKDQRVIVLHTPNGKQSSARNRGLEIASGRYITFVDSDDWLETTAYERCVDIIEVKQYPDILMFGYYRNSSDSETVHIVYDGEAMSNRASIVALVNRTDFVPSVVLRLFKKSILKDLFFCEGRVYEDVSFPLEAHLNAHTFYYYPYPLYHYRANESSTSFVMKEDIIELYLNLEDLLYRVRDSHPNWVPIVNATRIRWLQAHYEEIKSRGLKPERFKPIFRDMRKFPFSYTNWKNFLARWAFIHFPNFYTRVKQLLRK